MSQPLDPKTRETPTEARLAALGSDIGEALAQITELPEALQRCAEAIVHHLNAAFARIWILNRETNVLDLKASAGIYTHLDGPHSRIPVGSLRVGLIAQERQPHLTNDVASDPGISEPDWARREGIVGFAGYPLIVENRVVGVLALFARQPIAADATQALASVTTSIAIGIDRKRTEIALRKSEERYRFLAESMPQMVWTATPDGALNYVNSQASTYFGVTPDALLGAGWLSGVHPEDRGEVIKRWQHSLSTGEPYEMEFRLRRGSDGAWRWFLARAYSMPSLGGDSQDGVLAWVGTCTDIDEQKQGQQALAKANRELEEFAFVASHDLQEPLRMVNIFTQMILKRITSDDPVLNQYSGFVAQGVHRMEALIRDLLNFSRNIHGEQDAVIGTADLAASLKEALSVLEARIKEAGAVITADPLPLTRGDTMQLAHVFQNLISNSLKYRRQVPIEINISARLQDNRWLVSIQDNGIGFDSRYSERIFGLFKRLHKNEYPGTGLGLAICQRIVERYGGRIWAEGQPGQGAIFHFLLPQAADQPLTAGAKA